MVYRVSADIGGLEFSLEMGRIAKQADGAAFVSYGDTVVLVAACAAKTPKKGRVFSPLPWIIAKIPMPPERSREAFSRGKEDLRRRKS